MCVQDRVGKVKSSLIPEVEVDDISFMDKDKKIPTKKNHKGNGSKPLSDCLVTEEATSLCQSFKSVTRSENKRNAHCCREYIDLDCDTQENSR